MKGQRLAQDHECARIKPLERTAMPGWHAVAQPAIGAQQPDPFLAGAAVVGLVDGLLRRPVGQALAQFAVRVVGRGAPERGESAADVLDPPLVATTARGVVVVPPAG